jgi:hypothetical protein
MVLVLAQAKFTIFLWLQNMDGGKEKNQDAD